jgi:hypothetical protein
MPEPPVVLRSIGALLEWWLLSLKPIMDFLQRSKVRLHQLIEFFSPFDALRKGPTESLCSFLQGRVLPSMEALMRRSLDGLQPSTEALMQRSVDGLQSSMESFLKRFMDGFQGLSRFPKSTQILMIMATILSAMIVWIALAWSLRRIKTSLFTKNGKVKSHFDREYSTEDIVWICNIKQKCRRNGKRQGAARLPSGRTFQYLDKIYLVERDHSPTMLIYKQNPDEEGLIVLAFEDHDMFVLEALKNSILEGTTESFSQAKNFMKSRFWMNETQFIRRNGSKIKKMIESKPSSQQSQFQAAMVRIVADTKAMVLDSGATARAALAESAASREARTASEKLYQQELSKYGASIERFYEMLERLLQANTPAPPRTQSRANGVPPTTGDTRPEPPTSTRVRGITPCTISYKAKESITNADHENSTATDAGAGVRTPNSTTSESRPPGGFALTTKGKECKNCVRMWRNKKSRCATHSKAVCLPTESAE